LLTGRLGIGLLTGRLGTGMRQNELNNIFIFRSSVENRLVSASINIVAICTWQCLFAMLAIVSIPAFSHPLLITQNSCKAQRYRTSL
jgi:hypothetical protein